MLPEAGGRGNGELLFNRNRVPVWDDGQVLEIDNGDAYTSLQMYLMLVYYTFKNGIFNVIYSSPQYKRIKTIHKITLPRKDKCFG